MVNGKHLTSDVVCLDWANECLRRGSETAKLRPKTFAVLNYLLRHPGQLITKDELLNAVWPETFVSEANLKVAIRQIRQALGDESKSPSFIETAHRRGYRFIGHIVENGKVLEIRSNDSLASSSLHNVESTQAVVEREAALLRMQNSLEKMLAGERQILFVTGEAGIGKTALVDAFVRNISSAGIVVARGQCLEHFGTSEAYLPVLEAIGRLCREREKVIETLRTHAPMWLVQLPSLLKASERELLNREVLGATRERMLREIGEALEALTSELPVILLLEDLHWSDYSTLDLISYLGRQGRRAKLMVIGTYRPVELIVSGHPLKAVKQELLAKQQCEELQLHYLSENAVAEYLRLRFPDNRFPAKLARWISERTGGNPLFMVNAVDYLVAETIIIDHEDTWELVAEIENIEVGVPDSIKQMIEKQIDHLDIVKQRTLEAASVAGAEFSSLAVVAALDEDRATVESRFEELARQLQFVQDCGIQVLPNGEPVSRYGFIHALYRSVIYERVSPSRRVQFHRRIAARGEEVYGERSIEIAAELAMHFELGRDYERAAKYLHQAARTSIRRFAYGEAVRLSRRGLQLLQRLPDTPERARQELCLQLTLGVPLIATEGYAAPEVGTVYLRARELCQQLGDTPDISEVLWGLWTFHTLRADLATARDIAHEFLHLAERLPYPGLATRGHWAMEITYSHMGKFAESVEHFEKALSLYEPELHLDDAFLYALHPGVAMPCFAAWSLWFLGETDQALQRIAEALRLGRALADPHGLSHALFFAAVLHQLRREDWIARDYAEKAIAVASEHGLALYEAMARIVRAWTLISEGRYEESVKEIRAGLTANQATGTELLRTYFLALLAEALEKLYQIEEGLRLLTEALRLARDTGERYYEAELYRLKARLLISQSTARATESFRVMDAEACLFQAITIAQKQQARSLELRAAMDLARFYQTQGQQGKASDLLGNIYSRFTEGFNTVDLREAKALLNELSVECVV